MDDGQAIEVEVWSRPRIVLRSHYQLRPEAGGTRVVEAVAIDCPSLLAHPVLRQAERAHDRLLAALKQRLERSTG